MMRHVKFAGPDSEIKEEGWIGIIHHPYHESQKHANVLSMLDRP